MQTQIWGQIQQGSTGPTEEPGAPIQPQGCGGRKWKMVGWKGFQVEKEHQHQWVDELSQWCSWRRMSLRSGLHKLSLVCLLLLFHCLREGMISRGYGSGTITTNPLVCVLRLHIWRSVCVCVCVCVSTCLCHVVEATRLLANVRLCPLLCFKLSPLFFDLAKLSTCLFGSDLMLFKGCPDFRLAGSILFLLCLFVP